MKNALWGLFIGDALAMPAHWFYNTLNIPKYLDGPVEGYKTPPEKHIEASLVGAKYRPDVEAANKTGRNYDILHQHLKFYDTTYNDFSTSGFNIDQKGVIRVDDRYHYHYGLKAGENTLNAQLVRVLMRHVVENGCYNPEKFLDAFIEFMTTPNNFNDPYTEGFLRLWFENYSKGLPPAACADNQYRYPGINAMGGMIRPLVLSLLQKDSFNALGFALGHQYLTHHSENVSASLAVVVPLLNALVNGNNPMDSMKRTVYHLGLPKYTGMELFAQYQHHGGMGNVPAEIMWKLHSEFNDAPWDIEAFANSHTEADVLKKIFSTACFAEHGTPMLLYLAWKYQFDLRSALLTNVNAGGDNVHRGMILGLLLGATSPSIPDDMINGLIAAKELENEIDAFAEIAAS
ncbi:MAG: ADP-ribosylglycohydrolase family protein [Bacteroidales bacterium]|nr:ADP-ribosylglycohydrolase family protein [Bacteroidales bacterium]